METLRNITITVSIETNKRTETETFQLNDGDTDYEFADALVAAVEGYVIDTLGPLS